MHSNTFMVAVPPLFQLAGNTIIKPDGTEVARVYGDRVTDMEEEAIFQIEGNVLKNKFGTTMGEVKNNKIRSGSGFEYVAVEKARVSFKGAQTLTDIQIAGLWLWLVKGMR